MGVTTSANEDMSTGCQVLRQMDQWFPVGGGWDGLESGYLESEVCKCSCSLAGQLKIICWRRGKSFSGDGKTFAENEVCG